MKTTGLLLWLLTACGSADAADVFQRWAILSAPEVASSGLSDLLTAELSQRKFELVEREQLAAITKEIELSRLLSPAGSSQRLQIGKLLKADALVLLSLVEHEKKRFVKLVISDCHYGSRLRLDHFPFAAERVDKATTDIARTISETRTKFADGIERIIAVTPLLSKNVSHDFDHFAFGFATLLGQALSRQPGTVILELDEVRAISEELTRAAATLESRRVPWIIEGEFQVRDGGSRDKSSDQEQAVRLWLRSTNGRGANATAELPEGRLSAALSWLLETAPDKLVPRSATDRNSESIPRTEQRSFLIQRAERFSEVAAFAEATSLREAALLLEPEDWEQRLTLAGEYLRWYDRRRESVWREARTLDQRFPEEIRTRWRRDLALHQPAVQQHLETVLTCGQLSLDEGQLIVRRWQHSSSFETTSYSGSNDQRLQDAEFFWRMAERIKEFPDQRLRPEGRHPVVLRFEGREPKGWSVPDGEQFDYWGSTAWSVVVQNLPGWRKPDGNGRVDRQTLADVDRLVRRIFPSTRLSRGMVLRLTRSAQSDLPNLVNEKRVPLADVAQLYELWKSQPEPLWNFYGRLGLLGLKSTATSREAVTQVDLDELAWAQTFVTRWRDDHPLDRFAVDYNQKTLLQVQKDLERLQANGGREKKRPPAVNPLVGTDPYPRLAFEPLTQVPSPWTGLRKCRDDLDVMWSPRGVWFMPQAGVVKPVCSQQPIGDDRRGDDIYSVVWDGKGLWVSSCLSGVRRFDADGTQVGQWKPGRTADGRPDELPVFEGQSGGGLDSSITGRYPLMLFALEPGRCLVTGEYEPDRRRWFGVIEPAATRLADSKEPQVPGGEFRLWHHTIAPKQPWHLGRVDDVNDAFKPVFFLKWKPAEALRETLLVGRPTGEFRGRGREPLAFDTSTGVAANFPQVVYRNCSMHECQDIARVGDSYAFAMDFEIARVTPADDPSQPWRSETVWTNVGPDRNQIATEPGRIRPQLIVSGDRIYNPGSTWRRIDPKTWQVETLTRESVSPRFQFPYYADSAHFGLVAWHWSDVLHRIHVDLPADQPQDLAWLYPFVPASARERHHQAITSIRQRGGSVEAQCEFPSTWWIDKPRDWSTSAFLSKAWSGKRSDLQLLADVQGLQSVAFVQVPITDEDFRLVGQVQGLKSLLLEDTHVTPAGLQVVREIPLLHSLTLEGSLAGHEFDDTALDVLAGHETLARLYLTGRGFTDAGLATLASKTKVTFVSIRDSAVTQEGIAAARRLRRNLQIHVPQQL